MLKNKIIISTYLFVIVELLFSYNFKTILGEVELIVLENEKDKVPQIKNLIQSTSKNLYDKFGPIQLDSITIYITDNNHSFKKLSGNSTPEWGIAIAKHNPDIIVLKSPSFAKITFNRFKKVIIHEISHIYFRRITNGSSIPSWFMEGIAMQFSSEFSVSHKISISKAIWKNKIFSINELNYINNYKKPEIQLIYGQSASLIEALEYFYGENIIKKIIYFMNSGDQFYEALEKTTELNILEFDLKYLKFLKNQYRWIFLLNSSNMIFIIFPIIVIIGYVYKRYTTKIILKKWEYEEQNIED